MGLVYWHVLVMVAHGIGKLAYKVLNPYSKHGHYLYFSQTLPILSKQFGISGLATKGSCAYAVKNLFRLLHCYSYLT